MAFQVNRGLSMELYKVILKFKTSQPIKVLRMSDSLIPGYKRDIYVTLPTAQGTSQRGVKESRGRRAHGGMLRSDMAAKLLNTRQL